MTDNPRLPLGEDGQCPLGYRLAPDPKDVSTASAFGRTPCKLIVSPAPQPVCKPGEKAFEKSRALFEPGSPVTAWECRSCPEGQYWEAHFSWPINEKQPPSWYCKDKTKFTEGTATAFDYFVRDAYEASKTAAAQASLVATALVIFAIIRWWQMRDLSVVQVLGVLVLAGAGTYFVSTALKTSWLRTQEPLALSIGVMLLLAAFFVTRGWLAKR